MTMRDAERGALRQPQSRQQGPACVPQTAHVGGPCRLAKGPMWRRRSDWGRAGAVGLRRGTRQSARPTTYRGHPGPTGMAPCTRRTRGHRVRTPTTGRRASLAGCRAELGPHPGLMVEGDKPSRSRITADERLVGPSDAAQTAPSPAATELSYCRSLMGSGMTAVTVAVAGSMRTSRGEPCGRRRTRTAVEPDVHRLNRSRPGCPTSASSGRRRCRTAGRPGRSRPTANRAWSRSASRRTARPGAASPPVIHRLCRD